MNKVPSIIPKRPAQIYKYLSSTEKADAKAIARVVGGTPNAVYRDIQPLINMGIAEVVAKSPLTYQAVQANAAEKVFLEASLATFRTQFCPQRMTTDDGFPSIDFIKNKIEMREVTEQEAENASKSICIITSGHKVADSTIDVYRRATCRGIKLRAIIENHPRDNKNVDLEAYSIMRAETRYLPNLGMRLYIFDDRTVVITSYDPRFPIRAFGIRFTYSPVAAQLQELFDKRWDQSELIKR